MTDNLSILVEEIYYFHFTKSHANLAVPLQPLQPQISALFLCIMEVKCVKEAKTQCLNNYYELLSTLPFFNFRILPNKCTVITVFLHPICHWNFTIFFFIQGKSLTVKPLASVSLSYHSQCSPLEV